MEQYMTVSMYNISVPIFIQLLGALSNVLDKAAAHAEANRTDPSFLLSMRLYPNMYPMARQVQQATMHAARVCAALAGITPLELPNTEKNFPELKERIARTVEFLRRFTPDQIDGTEEKVITLGERQLPGQVMLLNRVLPHFYFHCTTAYDILRHCGVPLVKADFIGTPVQL
jgi:hypothetical protein